MHIRWLECFGFVFIPASKDLWHPLPIPSAVAVVVDSDSFVFRLRPWSTYFPSGTGIGLKLLKALNCLATVSGASWASLLRSSQKMHGVAYWGVSLESIGSNIAEHWTWRQNASTWVMFHRFLRMRYFCLGTHQRTPIERMYTGGNRLVDFLGMRWRRSADLHSDEDWRLKPLAFWRILFEFSWNLWQVTFWEYQFLAGLEVPCFRFPSRRSFSWGASGCVSTSFKSSHLRWTKVQPRSDPQAHLLEHLDGKQAGQLTKSMKSRSLGLARCYMLVLHVQCWSTGLWKEFVTSTLPWKLDPTHALITSHSVHFMSILKF